MTIDNGLKIDTYTGPFKCKPHVWTTLLKDEPKNPWLERMKLVRYIINSLFCHLVLATFLTEYITATSAISGLSLQALKFPSAIKHTGAAIIVAHKRYKKTKTSSAGYIFIVWVCKMPYKSNLASLKFLSHKLATYLRITATENSKNFLTKYLNNVPHWKQKVVSSK